MPDPLDLGLGQRAGLDPADRLAFEQLADQLDHGQDQPSQAVLDVVGLEGDPQSRRAGRGTAARGPARRLARGRQAGRSRRGPWSVLRSWLAPGVDGGLGRARVAGR